MARLRSYIFAQGLIRQASAAGKMASMLQKGRTEAGAVLVVSFDSKQNDYCAWAPAPQALIGTQSALPKDAHGGRFFEQRLTNCSYSQLKEYLARERAMDDDIWVVELEIDHHEVHSFITEVGDL